MILGKIEDRRRRGQQRMRWLDGHHQLNEREFEQTLGDSEAQGSLVCCSPWVTKNLMSPNCGDMTQASRNFIPQATATDCFRDRHKILAKSNLSQDFCQDYKLQEVTNAHLCHQVARVSQTEAKKSLHKQETKP